MKIARLDAFIICVGPILMAYSFFMPGMSFVEPLIILSLFLHFLIGDVLRNRVIMVLILIFAILFLHLLFAGVMGSTESLGYFRLVKYFILITFFAVAYKNIDHNILTKILIIVLAANFFALTLQHILHYFFGFTVSFIIPFLPLVNTDISVESINSVLLSDFRPGGLFLEPAHFSYFMFFTGVYLYKSNYEKNQTILLLICVALISTFSTFGLIASLSIFVLIIMRQSWKVKLIFLFAILVVVGRSLGNLEQFISLIPQLARIIDPESVAVTGRLNGGANQIEKLDNIHRLMGLGFGNFKLDGFVNGVLFLKLSFGNFGIILLSIMFFLFSFISYKDTPYLFTLLAMCFFTSMLLTPFILIALLPFLKVNKIEKN